MPTWIHLAVFFFLTRLVLSLVLLLAGVRSIQLSPFINIMRVAVSLIMLVTGIMAMKGTIWSP